MEIDRSFGVTRLAALMAAHRRGVDVSWSRTCDQERRLMEEAIGSRQTIQSVYRSTRLLRRGGCVQ